MNWARRYQWNRHLLSLIACVVGILIPLVQYHFRRFDDNTFTSWALIFSTTSPVKFFLALAAGAALDSLVAGISFPFPRALGLFLAGFSLSAFFWSLPEVNVSASRYVTQANHLELFGI